MAINVKSVSDLKSQMSNYTSEAARENFNKGGGFVLWSCPDSSDRHFAFHPIMFVGKLFFFSTTNYPAPSGAQTYSSGTGTVYQVINEAHEVLLPIYDNESHLVTTLHADTIAGEARFDVSTIVRTWFNTTMQDNDFNNYGMEDKMLSTKFEVHLDPSASAETEYVVQNAVSQVGSDGAKSFSADVFGQDNKHIVLWDTDADSCPTISVLIKTQKTVAGRSLNVGWSYQLPVSSQSDWLTLNAALGLTAAGFTFEDATGSQCGANCVRWLNRKGAIEYFVFRRGMSKQKTASTKTMREVYSEDYADIRTNRQATEVDGKRSITLRADGLTYDELDFLTKLPYSPHIQWFDPDNDMWVGVTVEQFDNTEVTKLRTLRNSGVLRNTDNLYSFEITLQCPAINMQF